MDFILESPAFQNQAFIPAEYTCQGKNYSPPLTWKNPPKNTKSFTLIMEDPDAPMGTWIHWVVFNLPPEVRQLHTHTELLSIARVGKNGWGNADYGGPCPPSGVHRYFFKLYALDIILQLDSNATQKEVEAAMQNHILGTSELMGKCEKNK